MSEPALSDLFLSVLQGADVPTQQFLDALRHDPAEQQFEPCSADMELTSCVGSILMARPAAVASSPTATAVSPAAPLAASAASKDPAESEVLGELTSDLVAGFTSYIEQAQLVKQQQQQQQVRGTAQKLERDEKQGVLDRFLSAKPALADDDTELFGAAIAEDVKGLPADAQQLLEAASQQPLVALVSSASLQMVALTAQIAEACEQLQGSLDPAFLHQVASSAKGAAALSALADRARAVANNTWNDYRCQLDAAAVAALETNLAKLNPDVQRARELADRAAAAADAQERLMAAREGVLQRADSLAAMQREHAALLAELAALAEQEAALRIQEAQAETVLAERVLVASLARLNAPAFTSALLATARPLSHKLLSSASSRSELARAHSELNALAQQLAALCGELAELRRHTTVHLKAVRESKSELEDASAAAGAPHIVLTLTAAERGMQVVLTLAVDAAYPRCDLLLPALPGERGSGSHRGIVVIQQAGGSAKSAATAVTRDAVAEAVRATAGAESGRLKAVVARLKSLMEA